MPFGEIPSIHESRALAEVRAQQVFESDMREIVTDPEVFATLEQGIPERCLRYVVKAAQAVRNDGNAYRKATWNVRQWLTTTNGFYLDRYVPEQQISLMEQRRHQEAVEELFMLLGDPGYARLILQELELRQYLHEMQEVLPATPKREPVDLTRHEYIPARKTDSEPELSQRPTVPSEQIDLLESDQAITRRPNYVPEQTRLERLIDEIANFDFRTEPERADGARDSGVRHVDGAKQVPSRPPGTRYAMPGKGQAEAIDFRLSDPDFE